MDPMTHVEGKPMSLSWRSLKSAGSLVTMSIKLSKVALHSPCSGASSCGGKWSMPCSTAQSFLHGRDRLVRAGAEPPVPWVCSTLTNHARGLAGTVCSPLPRHAPQLPHLLVGRSPALLPLAEVQEEVEPNPPPREGSPPRERLATPSH
jgi:hypothetical protein